MTTRRALTVAAAVLALLCGASPAAAEDKPLLLWHAYRAAEREALEATVRAWNEGARGKDPEIKLLAVPYDAFADKITAAVPRGHGPDLFIFAHDRVGDWAESGIVEPIEFWMTEAHADKFLFKAIDALCYGDSLFGLPLAFKSTLLIYNKALVPTPPATTDELLAMGSKVTDRAKGVFGLVYDNVKLYFHAPWLFGFGGALFDDKGTLVMDSGAARKALAFAFALGNKESGIVPPESTSTLVTSLFNQGKAAMAITGPWALGELSSEVDYGLSVLPTVAATGKAAGPFVGAEGVMMSRKCTRKAAAFRAMSFLTNDKMAVIRAVKGAQPVANVAAWDDVELRKSDKYAVLKVFRKQLDAAVVMPGTPQMRLVWSPYDIALQKVISGNATPAAALKEAHAEVTRYLEQARASHKGEDSGGER